MNNILAENMLRFGVKNLDIDNKLNLLVLSEQGTSTTDQIKNTEKKLDVSVMSVEQKQQTLAILQAEVDRETARSEDAKLKENIQELTRKIDDLTNRLVKTRHLTRPARKMLESQLEAYTEELQSIRSQIQPKEKLPKLRWDEKVEKWITVVGSILGSITSVILIKSELLDLKQKEQEINNPTREL